jgi:uncharacterized protein (DUF1499 family)
MDMRWIWIVAAAALLILAAFVLMALLSQRAPERLGLQGGQLRPCSESPNCVCSESFDTKRRGGEMHGGLSPASLSHASLDPQHAIAPLAGDAEAWRRMPQIMQALGGRIERQDGDYMHVTFASALFRYVDDVELR